MLHEVQRNPRKADRIQRAMVYIDGYNLYYGLRDAYGGRYKWLDLQSLSRSFLKSNMELVGVKYFTAITKASNSHKRQAIYLKALEAYCDKLDIILGRFLSKIKRCRTCGAEYPSYEEKKTIVAHPPRRKSEELCRIASGWFPISEQKLKRNQLPKSIRTGSGGRIIRPDDWEHVSASRQD
uniref:NYN domain-containing protein n=1 Tax=Candidatus Kentrum sp. LPFa TaxID=2126335 RepID=A0A450WCH2_9GAMM|nr:MAG: hypothetical protein BECKLPF1236A_GA0070988_101121 [Candidatus Kentron sp. LPFa]VFK30424.1 MAG: hypothetical protein BECKLPF1236C_GA0070990_101102 [Candidatus Kentron sp. LPFa]